MGQMLSHSGCNPNFTLCRTVVMYDNPLSVARVIHISNCNGLLNRIGHTLHDVISLHLTITSSISASIHSVVIQDEQGNSESTFS